MSHVVVALGGVTDAQIAPLLRAMQDTGLGDDIDVVRFDTLHASETPWVDVAADELVSYRSSRDEDGFMDRRIGEMKMEHIRWILGPHSLDDVKAIIYEVRADDNIPPTRSRWEWLVELLDEAIPAYEVNRSDSNPDEFYLVGQGFGEVIEAPSPA